MPQGRCWLPLVVAACLVSTAMSAANSDWTRFRGPNGTGIADDKDIPIKWTAKNILWQVALPGLGNSSPIIWKDHVYVQTATKDGKERALVCMSTKDGSMLWKRSLLSKNKKAVTHAKNTYASASPGVDAERVYAVFWDNVDQIMNAYTHDGEPLWAKDLGPFESQHGAGASPIPVGGKVYFTNDTDKTAVLVCLDGKTGATVWSQDRPHYRACYSSPFLHELPDGSQELIVVSTMGITGYDLDRGTKRWNWDWKPMGDKPLRTTASPVFSDGILFATGGDSPNGPRHGVAVKLGTTPTKVWESTKDFPYVPTMLTSGKHLYFVNDAGFAGCYEAATGKKVWYKRLEGEFSSSPVLIDGKIYAVNEFGDVFVIAASPEFQMLAKNSVGELVRATPAVADNRLYIRGQNHLFCIGKEP
jgi:outer membrane protein assembly factor BamB